MVMDVGKPLNPRIDIGQIEGAFMQGVGLFTMEQKVYLADGRDMTVGPGSYKIPALDDIPREFNVHILRYSPHRASVHSSKAIGEVSRCSTRDEAVGETGEYNDRALTTVVFLLLSRRCFWEPPSILPSKTRLQLTARPLVRE